MPHLPQQARLTQVVMLQLPPSLTMVIAARSPARRSEERRRRRMAQRPTRVKAKDHSKRRPPLRIGNFFHAARDVNCYPCAVFYVPFFMCRYLLVGIVPSII